jgi:hypothetical protein
MILLGRGVLALCCVLLCTGTHAQTVEELQRELAAKDARIKKLEQQLARSERKLQLTKQSTFAAKPASSELKTSQAATTSTVPPAAVSEDEDLDRALERTLVREGALVLPPWTYELTPQFSYAHWDKQIIAPFTATLEHIRRRALPTFFLSNDSRRAARHNCE